MSLVSIENFEKQVFSIEGLIIEIKHEDKKEKIITPYPYQKRASSAWTVEEFLRNRVLKLTKGFEVYVLDFNQRQPVPGFYRLRELFLQTY